MMAIPVTLRIGIAGAGVVGSGLALALRDAGYPPSAVWSRRRERRADLAGQIPGAVGADDLPSLARLCDLVFLTVSDDAIEAVARSVPWERRHSAVHCNGAASLDLLEAARSAGAAAGVFHPLQSFATAAQAAANLPGSTFGIDASTPQLLALLEDLARSLGGRPLPLRGDRAVYHAGAVFASNYLVTLLDVATDLWGALGIGKEDALRSLLPLVRGTVENLERIGLPRALTGPIARGDTGTIERHLRALRTVAPTAVTMYKELARRTVPIALAKGRIGPAAARRLHTALDDATGGNE